MAQSVHRPFVKVFETAEHGQILVTVGEDEDGCPQLLWTIKPPGLGPCSVGVSFVDSDDGDAQAYQLFEDMDEAEARRGANAILDELRELQLAEVDAAA